MARLSKEAIQRLAVLHTLAMWQHGAYGPVRLHKTLFFADKEAKPDRAIFTFKKWRLGQYSDEIAEALNALQEAGRISSQYDGPAERLKAEIPTLIRLQVASLFQSAFPEWEASLQRAFKEWAYLNNDSIIERAHDDPTYKTSEYGEVIFSSFGSAYVDIPEFDAEAAENLSDLVDVRLQRGLAKRLAEAVERPAKREDWRAIYFAG